MNLPMFSDVTDVVVSPRKPLHRLRLWLMKYAVSGLVPIRRFYPRLEGRPASREGRLCIEIVSHCWGYAYLQEYQLSSLVLAPPVTVDVVMTVYFSREDKETLRLLEFFASQSVANVTWQFRALPKELLFRRSIGRNHAALHSGADWVWFTDCDVIFGPGSLDTLGRVLQSHQAPLVFPRYQGVTSLLQDDQIRDGKNGSPSVRSIPPAVAFFKERVLKATGPLQITHGDIARGLGYCRDIPVYQTPELVWQKCQEDRAFRWLLGTAGHPIDVDGISRIRHLNKGRYTGSAAGSRLRTALRRVQDWVRGRINR